MSLTTVQYHIIKVARMNGKHTLPIEFVPRNHQKEQLWFRIGEASVKVVCSPRTEKAMFDANLISRNEHGQIRLTDKAEQLFKRSQR